MYIVAWKPPERFRQNKNFTGGNMTKKEFKEAMLRGLGRCVIAVRKEPEKYRELVLWACKRNFAYDAQSEGTRSWYTYTMAKTYPDKETFISATAEALRKYRPNGSWDLLHLSEVLMFFAMDGCASARQALEEKYQEILAAMFALKRRPNRIFHELSDLEQLGLVLAVDSKSFLRIAGDVFQRVGAEFSILACVFGLLGLYKYFSTTPEYVVDARIMLRSSDPESPLEQVDMLQVMGMGGMKQTEDEIAILTSRDIMTQVVRDLDLQSSYYKKKNRYFSPYLNRG